MNWEFSRWWALLPILGLFLLETNFGQIEIRDQEIAELATEQKAIVGLLNSPSIDAKMVDLPETGKRFRITPRRSSVLVELNLRVENTGSVPVFIVSPEVSSDSFVEVSFRPREMWLDQDQHDFVRVRGLISPGSFSDEFKESPEEFAKGLSLGTRRMELAIRVHFFSAHKPDAAFRILVKYALREDRLELTERRKITLNVESIRCSNPSGDEANPQPLLPGLEGDFSSCFVDRNAQTVPHQIVAEPGLVTTLDPDTSSDPTP